MRDMSISQDRLHLEWNWHFYLSIYRYIGGQSDIHRSLNRFGKWIRGHKLCVTETNSDLWVYLYAWMYIIYMFLILRWCWSRKKYNQKHLPLLPSTEKILENQNGLLFFGIYFLLDFSVNPPPVLVHSFDMRSGHGTIIKFCLSVIRLPANEHLKSWTC